MPYLTLKLDPGQGHHSSGTIYVPVTSYIAQDLYKIRLPKVDYPKFEGQLRPNEDEYQKPVQLKCIYFHKAA